MLSVLAHALALLVLTQSPPAVRVAVVDTSASDAVYEDVSRGIAVQVVDALDRAGVTGVRVDESELPPEGCKPGPCLAQVAKSQKAHVVVALEAEEIDKKSTRVRLAALWGYDGAPLAVAQCIFVAGKAPPKIVAKFATKVRTEATARLSPPK